ncbi:MAG: DNA polymerase III subunit delta [Oscillospiraceae bacterium]|jgi:DNA polymerase-3 subunit delta|nr:DNA polymerase III subunit delta [Oscillospiraceae bacterium]
MSVTETELKKQVGAGSFKNLYFFYGEESYLTSHYANLVSNKALGNDTLTEFNMHKLDGQTCSVVEIIEAAEALPVMAERKCVLVRDFDIAKLNKEDFNQLIRLVENMPESCVLIFWTVTVEVDVKKNDKWRAFTKAVDKMGVALYFSRKKDDEIVRLLESGASRRGCKLTLSNAKLMLRHCGNDMHILMGELDKLCALADGGEITREMIESCGTVDLEASVFELSKALLKGSYERAYHILGTLFAKREEPIVILAVLSSAYADLYRAKVALASGVRAETLADDFDYRRKEFRLKNAARDCARIPISVLRQSLEVLAEADRRIKSTGMDNRVVLEQTAARLIILLRQGENA